MALPQPPTNYAGTTNDQILTLTWTNGADALEVLHEYSYDGVTYDHFDHDDVPLTSSEHSVIANKHYYLRAKSRNSEGDSAYTPVIKIDVGAQGGT